MASRLQAQQSNELADTQSVFDINVGSLDKLMQNQRLHTKTKSDLIVTRNDGTLLKFCDVCKCLNLDPLHAQALPIVILFMSKSKHCAQIVQTYCNTVQASDMQSLLSMLDIHDEQVQTVQKQCEAKCNNMSDWIQLLQFLRISAPSTSALVFAESNQIVQRMQRALAESNFHATAEKKMPQAQVALWALLYTSLRCTPAGKMLEKLHADVTEQGPDSELKCLRTLGMFKDTVDDENAYAKTLVIVMCCFTVADGFQRSVASVLRQSKMDQENSKLQATGSRSTRPLLKAYAESAIQQRHLFLSERSWQVWRDAILFPVTTSSYLQKLLYFICAQKEQADVEAYRMWYNDKLLARAREVKIDTLDLHALLSVIDSLRLYTSNIKHLIDFRAKCLQGVNAKMRQELHLTQVLQLYIACFQHESVWEQCWKHILPVMNHTISAACKEFRAKYPYEVTEVVQNLGRCMLQE
tara:strand:+ start:202 stop:1605 length:1404 start_codon:yes stop_codon:yes gene_type:complete